MSTRNWPDYWLKRAQLNATMSTCLTRSVGAVAVRERRSFADAFNGNLPNALHCDEGGCQRCLDRDRTNLESGKNLERCICVHAEQNLVAFCAKNGIRMEGCTVYVTTHPCLDCIKLLIVAGVETIVYDEDYPLADYTDEFLSDFIEIVSFADA
jgi:dCMP deaminase